LARTVRIAALAGGLVAPASAAEPFPPQPDPAQQHAGIEHLRTAGMYVDSAVEELMARAPRGSCSNDPRGQGARPCVPFIRVKRDVSGASMLSAPAFGFAVVAAPNCVLWAGSVHKAAGLCARRRAS
jgi:hypothetical protein